MTPTHEFQGADLTPSAPSGTRRLKEIPNIEAILGQRDEANKLKNYVNQIASRGFYLGCLACFLTPKKVVNSLLEAIPETPDMPDQKKLKKELNDIYSSTPDDARRTNPVLSEALENRRGGTAGYRRNQQYNLGSAAGLKESQCQPTEVSLSIEEARAHKATLIAAVKAANFGFWTREGHAKERLTTAVGSNVHENATQATRDAIKSSAKDALITTNMQNPRMVVHQVWGRLGKHSNRRRDYVITPLGNQFVLATKCFDVEGYFQYMLFDSLDAIYDSKVFGYLLGESHTDSKIKTWVCGD